jgi:hypothetical protein
MDGMLEQFRKSLAINSMLKRGLPKNLDDFFADLEKHQSKEKDNAKQSCEKAGRDIQMLEMSNFAELLLDVITILNDENIEKITEKPAKEIRLHCIKLMSEIILKMSEKIN